MKNLKITFSITTIISISYFIFIIVRNYYSPSNIEARCIAKFQKDFKKGENKSEREWKLNVDIADNNYLKCMGIP